MHMQHFNTDQCRDLLQTLHAHVYAWLPTAHQLLLPWLVIRHCTSVIQSQVELHCCKVQKLDMSIRLFSQIQLATYVT